MQHITPETRRKFREISSEIRHIDDTIRESYERIEKYETSPYQKNNNDIYMRETDIQQMVQRRADLTLELRKMNRAMAMPRQNMKNL